MSILQIIIMLLWIFLGYWGVRRMYYGAIKDWYEMFETDYRKYKNGNNSLKAPLILSPLFIAGGGFSLLLSYGDAGCWYFKIPKD
jgi:hypothetical protein